MAEESAMWFWWFMFGCNLLVPLIQIIVGKVMWKHCPDNINWIYGYRTSRSMKNMETWRFAHDHCGRTWWKTGWIMLILSIIVQIPFYGGSEDAVGILGMIICTIQLIVLIASCLMTERALKKSFYDDGTRRG